MSNELMIKKQSILNKILGMLGRQKTLLEENIELYNFLRDKYSEEKRILGIIPIRVFGQEQLDKITGLDISMEDYIKSLKGIEELHNLKELYCRLGIQFDYDSICDALSNDKIEVKRLSIKSLNQLDGLDISKLPSDVKIVGYDATKEYEVKDGMIVEKKLFSNKIRTSFVDNLIVEPEEPEYYDFILGLKDRAMLGDLSFDEVKQLTEIAFGEGSMESQLVCRSITDSEKGR